MGKIATFDGAPAPGTINFGVGQPSADLLPVELIQTASQRFFHGAQPLELNYGELQGDARFRDTLADFLTSAYGEPASADSLLLSAGNSQALDFACTCFTQPGDTVFVEEPSYFLAFQIFSDHGLNIVGIPMDEHGMDMDRFEDELKRIPPKLVYTIPSYHNPGGQTLSLERRQRLVQLSCAHDFVIAADEVYQLLNYFEQAPAALGTMAEEGRVLSLGSFSKILAPGLRLGWIQSSTELMETLLASGYLNSGGSFNHMTSHIVRHAIEMGLQEAHIEFLRKSYRGRLEAMDSALREHVGDVARWDKPRGGYFFWLEMPDGVNTTVIKHKAAEFKTGFQPGALFSSKRGCHNFLRVSFAHYNEEDIHEGVVRLAALLKALVRLG